MDVKVNDDYLEETLVKVERVRNWSPRVISKLENFIHTANDEDLFRVSPLQWASEKNVDEHEAIDLFLHSTKAGLFYMDWNVICPCCGKITQSFRDLHSVAVDKHLQVVLPEGSSEPGRLGSNHFHTLAFYSLASLSPPRNLIAGRLLFQISF